MSVVLCSDKNRLEAVDPTNEFSSFRMPRTQVNLTNFAKKYPEFPQGNDKVIFLNLSSPVDAFSSAGGNILGNAHNIPPFLLSVLITPTINTSHKMLLPPAFLTFVLAYSINCL